MKAEEHLGRIEEYFKILEALCTLRQECGPLSDEVEAEWGDRLDGIWNKMTREEQEQAEAIDLEPLSHS